MDGACEHGPKDCDDGNPCTDDSCDGGTWVHLDRCDDDNECTKDLCVGGECAWEWTCDDDDPCTIDECVERACVHTPKDCDDGDECTENDRCDAGTGACLRDPKVCEDDGNPCTRDLCDPQTGDCIHQAKADGTPCADDGNECTNDVCQNGACVHPARPDGTPCPDDGEECTDDICQSGSCTHPPVPDGTQCTDDGEPCTDDICETGECAHDWICAPRLKRLTFGAKLTVIQDYGVPYSGPDWQDDNDDGDASDAGEHRFPVAYVTGQYGRVASIEFIVGPSDFPQGATVVRGTDSLGAVYETDQVSVGGNVLTATNMLATQPFPTQVRYFGDDIGGAYVIAWEISGDTGATWHPAGQSDNRLFLLLGYPSGPFATLYETVAWISCRGASGASTGAQVYAGSWCRFAGLSITRKPIDGYNLLDGAALRYWATITPNHTLGGLLADLGWHDGACCAWAQFLIACGNIHGIWSDYVMVTADEGVNPGADGFLVKSWTFLTPSGSGRFPYLIDTDVLDGDGLPGQNNEEPVAQAFLNHFVARRIGSIYDPSYGAGPFATENDHENAAIDGITSGWWAKQKDLGQELLYQP